MQPPHFCNPKVSGDVLEKHPVCKEAIRPASLEYFCATRLIWVINHAEIKSSITWMNILPSKLHNVGTRRKYPVARSVGIQSINDSSPCFLTALPGGSGPVFPVLTPNVHHSGIVSYLFSSSTLALPVKPSLS